jgi:hypothetical protein
VVGIRLWSRVIGFSSSSRFSTATTGRHFLWRKKVQCNYHS